MDDHDRQRPGQRQPEVPPEPQRPDQGDLLDQREERDELPPASQDDGRLRPAHGGIAEHGLTIPPAG